MSKLDANFFKPFVDGTLATLKIQCQMDVKIGKPFIKGTQKNTTETELTAIIGLTSEGFTGTIALFFSKAIYLAMMEKMLGEKYTEITKDLEDGAAEMLNIIFGHAKKVLNAQGHSIQKAIPTIIRGKQVEVKHLTSNPVMVLTYQVPDLGEFFMEISTEATAGAADNVKKAG